MTADSDAAKRAHGHLGSESTDEHRRAAEEFGEVDSAIVVVSDSRYEDTDTSGDLAESLISRFGHNVVERTIVPNDPNAIAGKFHELAGTRAKFVVFCGGTGLSEKDLTVETIRPLLEKILDGYGESFRRFSWDEIGPAAMLSRAIGGTAKGCVVVCTPGSTAAVRLALEDIVLPELDHIVREANR
ncbi:MAG: molybdenum cofactor biosynthesis protein B [Gammaproteobacteria bacterium]|jgi:molybdenum cofactor biosynthesis protein B|nr:molybdenum cofactor biosynthesis protein B [Gammaproteobacteria bacterium]